MPIPKLQDIAAATGVHEMTVSRALRNVGRMRMETRRRVLEAARTMGYRPNAAAAAMRTGRTGCIAMISGPGPHAAQFAPCVLSGIVEAVAGHGGYLTHAVLSGNVDADDATTLPRVLGRRMAEGLLLNCMRDTPPHFETFLQRNALPAVWMNCKRACNAVYPDDFGAVQKATGKLVAMGHKRIALVRLARAKDLPKRPEHAAVADCVAGYEAAMRQAGLRPDVLVFARHWDQWDEPIASRLQPLAQAFCDPAHRPTAVIAYRDGPVLMGLLQKLGLQVPDDVSMVSFTGDASNAAEQMVSWAPIPFETMGRKAVEMLYQLIESGVKKTTSVSIPYGEIASMHTVRKII